MIILAMVQQAAEPIQRTLEASSVNPVWVQAGVAGVMAWVCVTIVRTVLQFVGKHKATEACKRPCGEIVQIKAIVERLEEGHKATDKALRGNGEDSLRSQIRSNIRAIGRNAEAITKLSDRVQSLVDASMRTGQHPSQGT